MRSAGLWMIPTVVAFAAAASASPPRLRSLAPAAIQQFGGWGADEYERQFKDRPVKFSVDVDNGVGFYDGGDGIIGLPAKDLNEEAVSKAARSQTGAPACHLSLSQRFQLVVDGKPVSRNRVHHLRYVGVDGLEHWTAIFSCTIKEKTEGERELWVYGKDKEPIYKAPLKESARSARPARAPGSSGPLGLAAMSGGDEKLVLNLTFLGKYAGELELWCGESISPEDFPATTDAASVSALSSSRRSPIAVHASKPTDFGAIQFGNERAGYLADGSKLPKRPRVLWTFHSGPGGTSTRPAASEIRSSIKVWPILATQRDRCMRSTLRAERRSGPAATATISSWLPRRLPMDESMSSQPAASLARRSTEM